VTPLLVVIGCPSDPWIVQAFTWTGGLFWLLALCVGMVIAFEKAQRWARQGEES
jgi:hypothetical protein